MTEYERGMALRRKCAAKHAMLIGSIQLAREAIIKWEGRRTDTIGDILGVIIAVELLVKSAKDWAP